MNKQKSGMMYLLIGAICAALAAILVVNTVRSFNETTKVVVAIRNLQPFQKITADDLQVRDVPKITAPADAISDPKEIVGSYTKDALYKDDVVYKRRLATTKGDQSMLAAQITELKDPAIRAFAIPYDVTTAVGGEIKAGDRIDIIAQVKIDTGNGSGMGVGKVISKAVQVLKVTGATDGKGVLILALKPPEIEHITFAMTSGQLRFALNPLTTDPAAANTPGVTGAQWLQAQGFHP